jgi:hypothetical protein
MTEPDPFATPAEGFVPPSESTATPAYGAPGYPAGPGPVASPRSIGTCILLAVVTLGIYTFVWTWKTHDEIKRHSGSGVGGPLGFLIYFVISPVTYFLLAGEVRQMLALAGRPSRVKGTTGLWVLLPLLGPFIWFVKVQGQLNEYWETTGTQSRSVSG